MLDQKIDSLKEQARKIYEGQVGGFTSGSVLVDKITGRLQLGQIWTIGGYTGTGKSYYVVHLIRQLFTEWTNLFDNEGYVPPKIAVFSTELSTEEYINRYTLSNLGVYLNQYIENPQKYYDRFIKELNAFQDITTLNPSFLNIYGNVFNIAQIETVVNNPKLRPNLIIIDYVQGMSITHNGKLYSSEVDAMSLIPKKILELANKHNIAFVVVSQMNESVSENDNVSFESVRRSGLSYGKTLAHASHLIGILHRDKINGQLENNLNLHIVKNRTGYLDKTKFQIKSGFKLEEYLNY